MCFWSAFEFQMQEFSWNALFFCHSYPTCVDFCIYLGPSDSFTYSSTNRARLWIEKDAQPFLTFCLGGLRIYTVLIDIFNELLFFGWPCCSLSSSSLFLDMVWSVPHHCPVNEVNRHHMQSVLSLTVVNITVNPIDL